MEDFLGFAFLALLFLSKLIFKKKKGKEALYPKEKPPLPKPPLPKGLPPLSKESNGPLSQNPLAKSDSMGHFDRDKKPKIFKDKRKKGPFFAKRSKREMILFSTILNRVDL